SCGKIGIHFSGSYPGCQQPTSRLCASKSRVGREDARATQKNWPAGSNQFAAILNVLEGRPRARPFFIARMGHGAAAVVVGRMQMRGLLRGQTSSLVPRIARTTKTAAQPRMSLCSIRATDALKFKALGSGALMSGCRPMAADEHTFRRVRGQEGPSPRA